MYSVYTVYVYLCCCLFSFMIDINDICTYFYTIYFLTNNIYLDLLV